MKNSADTYEQLMVEIERLRKEMYAIRLKNVSLNDPQLIIASGELDKKIIEIQKMMLEMKVSKMKKHVSI